ncbi:MAG: hypothetical protein AAF449_18775 [Myxococcota bacterium]
MMAAIAGARDGGVLSIFGRRMANLASFVGHAAVLDARLCPRCVRMASSARHCVASSVRRSIGVVAAAAADPSRARNDSMVESARGDRGRAVLFVTSTAGKIAQRDVKTYGHSWTIRRRCACRERAMTARRQTPRCGSAHKRDMAVEAFSEALFRSIVLPRPSEQSEHRRSP